MAKKCIKNCISGWFNRSIYNFTLGAQDLDDLIILFTNGIKLTEIDPNPAFEKTKSIDMELIESISEFIVKNLNQKKDGNFYMSFEDLGVKSLHQFRNDINKIDAEHLINHLYKNKKISISSQQLTRLVDAKTKKYFHDNFWWISAICNYPKTLTNQKKSKIQKSKLLNHLPAEILYEIISYINIEESPLMTELNKNALPQHCHQSLSLENSYNSSIIGDENHINYLLD